MTNICSCDRINAITKIDVTLVDETVVANFATTATDGKKYQVDYYNLDVIISVGYRVKSQRGVQFRIWATNILKEYLKKGFVMDDEEALDKAKSEYRKYQEITLTPVEVAYLESVKDVAKKVKKK